MCVRCAGDCALIDERPGDKQVGGDIVQLPEGQAHAEETLPIDILGGPDGRAYLRGGVGWVFGDGMRKEDSLR